MTFIWFWMKWSISCILELVILSTERKVKSAALYLCTWPPCCTWMRIRSCSAGNTESEGAKSSWGFTLWDSQMSSEMLWTLISWTVLSVLPNEARSSGHLKSNPGAKSSLLRRRCSKTIQQYSLLWDCLPLTFGWRLTQINQIKIVEYSIVISYNILRFVISV